LCGTTGRARRGFPEPEGPRISTARGPTSTAEAWMVGEVTSHHRRQAHDEARAEHLRAVEPIRDADAVLGTDTSAMRFDDLARDRQAEAGVLAEALMRTVGVETLEDALHRFRLDAGAVVVDCDLDRVAQPLGCNAHCSAPRREGGRVLDQIVDHLAEARVMPRHHESARHAALECQYDLDAIVA